MVYIGDSGSIIRPTGDPVWMFLLYSVDWKSKLRQSFFTVYILLSWTRELKNLVACFWHAKIEGTLLLELASSQTLQPLKLILRDVKRLSIYFALLLEVVVNRMSGSHSSSDDSSDSRKRPREKDMDPDTSPKRPNCGKFFKLVFYMAIHVYDR